MSTCPNPNTPEWKALVAALGNEGLAMSAYKLNNFEVPSIDEANELLNKLTAEPKDEQLARSSDLMKLNRAVAQRTQLETAMLRATPGQKETIQRLIDMNTGYQEFLKNNIELAKQGLPTIDTISTTNFIGVSDFQGDPKKYEAFKHFGTFMHNVLETAQVQALTMNSDIERVLSREYFQELYDEYINDPRTAFVIDELTVDEMYEMAKRLAMHVAVNNDSGFLILPEITVVGKTRASGENGGTNIIGRVDLLLIDSDGTANIFDFKTKKVKNSIRKDKLTGEVSLNIEDAIEHLATKSFPVSNNKGASIEFQGNTRTAFDTWALQLKVYQNLMAQQGIKIGKAEIYALLYQTSDDLKFLDAAIYVFRKENFYETAATVNIDGEGRYTRDLDSKAKALEEQKKKVDKEIPISEEMEEEMRQQDAKVLDFTPTAENNTKLRADLEDAIDRELKDLQRQIGALDKDKSNPRLREILAARRKTLNDFKAVTARQSTNDLSYSINFSIVLDSVEGDLRAMEELSNAALAEFRTKPLLQSSKEIVQVMQAFSKTRGMTQIVNALTEIVNEARADKPEQITADTEVMKKLSMLQLYNERVEANFREVGLATGIKILQTPGEKTFRATKEDIENGLRPELERLRGQYEKLKAGKAIGIFSALKSSMLSFVSAEYKKKLAERLGPNGEGLMDEVQNVERRIKKLEALIEGGLDFSDEALERYIKGVTDPKSQIYIGATDIFNPSTLLSGISGKFKPGDFMASVSDSELSIASFTMMFKNAMMQAVQNMQGDMIGLDFDKMRDKLLQKMSVEELNEKVSEWRTVKIIDDETGEVEEKRVLYFTKPMSEKYEQTYREFNSNIRQLNKEIYELRQVFNAKFNTPERNDAEQDLLNKIHEKEVATDDYLNWMTENSSLPYKDEFYKLQQMLPQDIRDELQKKYLEIQVITHQVGAGNEILLEDHDFERIKELEVEIRKLREDAKKRNPDYANYMTAFEDLYEFVPNMNLFERMKQNAMTRYADDPERKQKWLKDNTIDRPKAEWFEKLADLYEQRSQIWGSNDDIKALMEERRAILAPHKIGGRINPQFLTAEEIEQLDIINAKIDTVIEGSKKSKDQIASMSEADLEKSSEITAEINRIAEKRISERYKELFDKKLNFLYNANKLRIAASNKLDLAKVKGTPEEINDAINEEVFYANQFKVAEDEFETWYNLNHEDEYKSITEGHDVRSNRVPKSFHREYLPAPGVFNEYMEFGAPHPKFSMKRLKETAKNPDFLQSADGIPMPKAISKNANGHYVITPGYEGSENVNEKYKQLMRDGELFTFYNKLMDLYFKRQSQTEGRKVGYMVPGFAASTVESIATEGLMGSFQKQWKTYIDKNVKTFGEQDKVDNAFGDLGGRIRMRYTKQLSEDLQSKDAIGCMMKYCLEANYNIAMQEVTPMADAFIEYLELLSEDLKQSVLSGSSSYVDPVTGERKVADMSNRQKQLATVIDQMKFERRKFAYGQAESDNKATRKVRKMMNQVFAYTSFIRMGFDVANQAKNFFSGNVQAWIAAGKFESSHYSRADMLWAKGKIYGYNGFLHQYFADWGKVSDISDSTLMYRMFNPAQKDFMQYMDEVTGGRSRKAKATMLGVQELGYMIQDKGDTEVALSVMYAVMNRYKFKVIEKRNADGSVVYKKDEEGKDMMVSAHEAYIRDPKTNMLVIRQDVEYTKDDESRIRNIIYSEVRRAQGNYAKADMTKFEDNPLGKLAFFYRKYLVPQLLNRFGYLRPNWEAGEAALGYWRAVGQAWKYFGPANTLKHFILGSGVAKKFGSSMDVIKIVDPATGKVIERQGSLYSRKVDQARRDALAMFIMWALSMMVMSYLRKKDDDDELGLLEGNAIRVLWGVKGETMSMFPLGGGSDEYIRNFTSLTVFTRELDAIKRLGSHSWNLGLSLMYNGGEEPDPEMDGDMAYDVWKDSHYTKKSGSWEKGDAKLVKDIYDMTGIRNFKDIINPNDRITTMKSNQ
jgi:hypothetical protein